MQWGNYKGKFDILALVLQDELSKSEIESFWRKVLPFIQELVMKTPDLFKNKMYMMFSNSNCTIELSREQCACILANSFFCTFQRPSPEMFYGITNLPSINFDELCNDGRMNIVAKMAKLHMIMHYFERISEKSKICDGFHT